MDPLPICGYLVHGVGADHDKQSAPRLQPLAASQNWAFSPVAPGLALDSGNHRQSRTILLSTRRPGFSFHRLIDRWLVVVVVLSSSFLRS